MQLTILNKTEHLIVVVKPAAMLSVPARFNTDERLVLGKLLEQQFGTQIFPVHRLDFEVSGIMLYALHPGLHRELSMAFEAHEIQKTYHALAENHEGNLDIQQWHSILVKGKKRAFEAPYGKKSITQAQCLKNFPAPGDSKKILSLWKLSPKTGRSHQLRFEMMKHLHPIVGDKLYHSNYGFGVNHIALCATSIILPESLQKAPWHLESTYALSSDIYDQLLCPNMVTTK